MTADAIPTTWPVSADVQVSPDSDSLDDAPRIQAAIDDVSDEPLSSGHRGIVLLAPGTYEVAETLRIRASGVVLRGAGQGVDGSVLRFNLANDDDLIVAGNARASTLVEAETYEAQFGTATVTNGELTAINNTTNGDWLQYDGFDFTGVQSITFRMSGEHDGSTVRIRTDGPTGALIGECATPNTGSWTVYETFTCPVSAVSGKKDLVISFHRADAQGVGRLDYFRSRIWNEAPGSRRKVTSSVPSGGTTLTVTDATPYAPGDKVMILREPTQGWLDDLTDPDGQTTDWNQQSLPLKWTVGEYELAYERVIASISGNQLTVDVPLVQALNTTKGITHVVKVEVPRLTEIGIEHLRMESTFAHDTDEAHGENAIRTELVENAWVRNVTGKHFWYSLVRLEDSRFVTVQDASMVEPKSLITGSRRYAYSISGLSSMNLFQRLFASEGRHVHVMGQRVPGPNVFLDAVSEYPFAEDGPHQRYATGVLYDNIRGKHKNNMRVRNSSAVSTGPSGHGWTGAQVVLWNNESHGVWVESPPGAMNFALGTVGSTRTGADATRQGRFEDWVDIDVQIVDHVAPRSLYLQQLKDRLGDAAVNRVATREQTYGPIWSKLASWAGQPFMVEESFDALATSQAPLGWSVDTSGGTVQVLNTTNKYVRLNDTSSSSVVGLSRSFSPTWTTLQAEFKIHFSSTTDFFYASLYSGSTEAIRIRTDGAGNLQVQNGASYQDLQGFAAGTWYSIKIVADPTEDTAEVYVDGVLRQRQGMFKNSVASIDRIEFRTHTGGTNISMRVDDVWVKEKPVLLADNFSVAPLGPWTISGAGNAIIAGEAMHLSGAVTASREFSPSDTRVTLQYRVKFLWGRTCYHKVRGGEGYARDLLEAVEIRADDGFLEVRNGVSYDLLGEYESGEWLDIKIVVYPESGVADIYVRDMSEPQVSNVPLLVPNVAFIRQMAFEVDPSGGQQMDIDDLLVKN